jgi:hypothetical protein
MSPSVMRLMCPFLTAAGKKEGQGQVNVNLMFTISSALGVGVGLEVRILYYWEKRVAGFDVPQNRRDRGESEVGS